MQALSDYCARRDPELFKLPISVRKAASDTIAVLRFGTASLHASRLTSGQKGSLDWGSSTPALLRLWPGKMPAIVTAALISICAVIAVGQQVSYNGRFAKVSNGASFPQRFSWAAASLYIPFQDAQNITIAFSRVAGTGPSQFEIRQVSCHNKPVQCTQLMQHLLRHIQSIPEHVQSCH